jgi:hypothetical protein
MSRLFIVVSILGKKEIQMDSAGEFAEKIVSVSGYTAAEREIIYKHWETLIAARDAEIEALRAPGPCGKHPKVFWQRRVFNEVNRYTGMGQYVSTELDIGEYCTVCAELAARNRELRTQARDEGANWMLDSIRASLQGYPNCGGDIEVMAEVDKIVRKAQEQMRERAARAAEIAQFVAQPGICGDILALPLDPLPAGDAGERQEVKK